MPSLYFEVQADYDKVIRLRQEIEELEKTLKGFDGFNTADEIKRVTDQLQVATAAYKSLTKAAAEAGAQMAAEAQSTAKVIQATKVPKVKVDLDVTEFNSKQIKLLEDLNSAVDDIKGFAAEVQHAFSSVKELAGWAIPAGGIFAFLERMKNIRADFQDMESTMKTFLGSAEKGQAMMDSLQDYAYYNMFEFKDLVGATKQMVAYGVETKKIIPTLDNLSNIATGTGGSLMEMVSMYNRAKSIGYVDSRTQQSWASKGIVLKDELAKIGEVAKNNKVTFEQLDKVLESMTHNGGMFEGVMDSQMQNISASIGQLQDNTDLMFNTIGEKLEEPLRKVIDIAAAIIDNLQTFGGVVADILGNNFLTGWLGGFADWLTDTTKEVGEWAEKHPNKVKNALTATMAVWAAYKISAVASEKSVQAAMDETIAKAAELKRGVNDIRLDDDLQKFVDLGRLDSKKAAEQQEARNLVKANGADDKTLKQVRAEQNARLANAEAIRKEREELQKLIDIHNEESDPNLISEKRDKENTIKSWDDDIQTSYGNNEVSFDDAVALQETREAFNDILRIKDELIQSDQKELAAANDSLATAQKAVDAASKRREEAEKICDAVERIKEIEAGDEEEEEGELEKLYELASGYDEQTAKMELNAAETEENTAIKELQAAQELRNTKATNLANDTEARNTLEQQRNNLARRQGTIATNQNAVATQKSTIATKLHSAGQRLATTTSRVFKTTIDQVSQAFNGLKYAIMTNPLGILVTLLSTAIPLLVGFFSKEKEAAEGTDTFGKKALETKDNVETLIATLKATDKNSKTHKDAMKELLGIYKEYGMAVKNQSGDLDELISKKERLIQLIMEEGRQEQIAAAAKKLSDDNEATRTELRTNIKDALKGDLKGDAAESIDVYANMIANDVEMNAKKLNDLDTEIRDAYAKKLEAERKANHYGATKEEDAARDAARDAYREIVQKNEAEMKDLVMKSAKNFAKENKQTFDSDKAFADMRDTRGWMGNRSDILRTSSYLTKGFKGFVNNEEVANANAEALAKSQEAADEMKDATKGEDWDLIWGDPEKLASAFERVTEGMKTEKAEAEQLGTTLENIFTDATNPEEAMANLQSVGNDLERLKVIKEEIAKQELIGDDADKSFKELYDESDQILGNLEELGLMEVTPKIDIDSLSEAEKAAMLANGTLKEVDGQIIQPRADTTAMDEVTRKGDAINGLIKGLQGKEFSIKGILSTAGIPEKLRGLANLVKIGDKDNALSGFFESMAVTLDEAMENRANGTGGGEKSFKEQYEDFVKKMGGNIAEISTPEGLSTASSTISTLLNKAQYGSAERTYLLQKQREVERKKDANDPNKQKQQADRQFQESERVQKLNKQIERAQQDEALNGEKIKLSNKLHLTDMDKARLAEIDQILGANKLQSQLEDKITQLREQARSAWVSLHPGASARQWKPTKEQEAEFEKEAKTLMGYTNAVAENDAKYNKTIGQINEEALQADINYNKEYGTYYNRRLAIVQEYEQKILNAKNDWEKELLKAQRNDELFKLDTTAVYEYLAEYGNFEQQKLAITQKYEKEIADAMREGGWAAAAPLMNKRDQELQQLQSAEVMQGLNWDSVMAGIANYSNEYLAQLQTQLEDTLAKNSVTLTLEDKGKILDKIAEIQNTAASNKGTNLPIGGLLGSIRDNRAQIAAAQRTYEFKKQAREQATQERENAELKADNVRTHLFSTLIGGGVKGKDGKDLKIDEVTEENASALLAGVDDNNGLLQGMFANLANKKAKAKEAKDAEQAAQGEEEAAANAADNAGMTTFEATDMFIHGINDNLQSMNDLFDDMGLSDTAFGKGFADFAESSQYATAAFDSLKNGDFAGMAHNLVQAFGSLGNVLGRMGIGGMGNSDFTLEDDIEALTNSNEALQYAIEQLSDDLNDASVADAANVSAEAVRDMEEVVNNTSEMMTRSAKAYNNGFLGIGGKGSTAKKVNNEMSTGDWQRVAKAAGISVRNASDFFSLTSEQMANVAKKAPDLYAKIKAAADDGYKDASVYMDDYIGYYKQLEEMQDQLNEKLTQTSFDQVASDFKSMLLDMESDAEAFADSFEDMMKQAAVNALMDNYTERLQTWYENFAEDMRNGNISAAEQESRRREYEQIAEDAIREREALREMMGWRASTTQQGGKSSFQSMSQDTGNELNGRFAAIQVSVEGIRQMLTAEQEQFFATSTSVATINDHMLSMLLQSAAHSQHYSNVEQQMARMYMQLMDINDNTKAIVQPIKEMSKDIEKIKLNTNKL